MEQVRIGKTLYRVLSDEETNIRRRAFISNPDMVAGIDKLTAVMGYTAARDYFSRVLENLKYEEVKESAQELYCPRPKFHKDPKYMCSINCPVEQEKENEDDQQQSNNTVIVDYDS